MEELLPLVGSLISGGLKLFGGQSAQASQEKIAAENLQEQINFAQHGLQWRANDATLAEQQSGINRLALLGVPTTSYSNQVGSTALGDSIGSAGQDIGRAVAALAPTKLRNAELENKLLEAKIRNFDADTVARMKDASDVAKTLGQPGTPPAMPTPDPRGPVINLYQRARTPDGRVIDIPSEKAASPLQTLGALPTNAGMMLRDFMQPIIETGNRLHEGTPSWDELYGQARRAVSDFTSSIYDRNTSGY